MPEARPEHNELVRLHERIDQTNQRFDQVMDKLAEIAESQGTITASCGPCKTKVASLDAVVNGNGGKGLRSRVDVLESGKTDTLSIGGFKTLLAAVGLFAGALAGAIGAVVAAVMARAN